MKIIKVVLVCFCVIAIAGWASGAKAAPVLLYVMKGAEPCVLHGAKVLEQKMTALGFEVDRFEGYADAKAGKPVIMLTDLSVLTKIGSSLNDFDRLVRKDVPARAESYAVVRNGNVIYGAGRDAVGTMYAAYDIAEQLEIMGGNANIYGIETRSRFPYAEIRAVNPFLQVEAFQDQNSWFYDKKYWETYLDELSWDRYNLLDVHAMYELISTFFPNCYLYLLKSEKFPRVGVSGEQAKKNLAMFNWMIETAYERGIRVSLMSYHASWKLTDADKIEEPSDADMTDYTGEMVRMIIDKCPRLWMTGFRIGESGRPADFFEKSYIAGIKEASRPVYLFTRTWAASPEQVLTIPEAYPNRTFLEIKYNGEHLGLPYHAMTTDRRGSIPSYTWEAYSNWPRKYKIIWQIRANGTHRLFRWGDPVFAARAMRTTSFASGVGFTMEPMTSYYPPIDFFSKPGAGYDFFKWDHQRNWFWYMAWGRLGYNPDEPKDVWQNRFRAHYGAAGNDALEMLTQMSRIVPMIYSWRCLGPDHRNMAPEYETGGTLNEFMENYPLDPMSIRSVDEYVNHYLYNDPFLGAKLGPFEAADLLDRYAAGAQAAAERASALVAPGNKEFESLNLEMKMLGHLARYYSNKIRASAYLNYFQKKNTWPELQWAKKYTLDAIAEWDELSELGATNYKPILDTLRMSRYVNGKSTFTWGDLRPLLNKDLDILNYEEERFKKLIPESGEGLYISHLPKYSAMSGVPLRVSATVLGGNGATEVDINYSAAGEENFKHVRMTRETDSYSYVGIIPAEDARGQVDYFISAEQVGAKGRYPGKQLGRPAAMQNFDMEEYADGSAKESKSEVEKRIKYEKKKFVTIAFVPETDPPRFDKVDAVVVPPGKSIRITVRLSDASPVASVKLFYKRMPTNYVWEDKEMTPAGDGSFTAELNLTPEGLLYYFQAADANGNAAPYPNFLEATPYLVIDSWDPAANPYVQ
jgi:hypothetical protein